MATEPDEDDGSRSRMPTALRGEAKQNTDKELMSK
jgi:hypothetical protein